MPKKANVVKIEKVPLSNPLEGNDSDNEIELKQDVAPSAPPAPSAVLPKKERKKINITEEERERRRQSMILTREKKMEKARERQMQVEMISKAREDEMNKKLLKKAEQLRKKQERELLNKIMFDEFARREEEPDDEPSNFKLEATLNPKGFNEPAEEVKQKAKPPAPTKQRVVQPQKVYQQPPQPVFTPPPPVFPSFRWV
jgi:hypothetical protein